MTNAEAISLLKQALAEIEWTQPMQYAAAIDKAIEALEGKDKDVPTKWISVKDRLPEDDTKVLVLTPKGRMRVARVTVPHQRINKRYDPLEAWWWVDGFDRSVNATHWMPLPEPPKEGDGE